MGVVKLVDGCTSPFKFVYPSEDDLLTKITKIATTIYCAEKVTASDGIKKKMGGWSKQFPGMPVCMAKTQNSFTTDAGKRGAPSGHTVEIREVRIANGAGFVVAICGEIMTMPGLPAKPSAEVIDITPEGKILGLFWAAEPAASTLLACIANC